MPTRVHFALLLLLTACSDAALLTLPRTDADVVVEEDAGVEVDAGDDLYADAGVEPDTGVDPEDAGPEPDAGTEPEDHACLDPSTPEGAGTCCIDGSPLPQGSVCYAGPNYPPNSGACDGEGFCYPRADADPHECTPHILDDRGVCCAPDENGTYRLAEPGPAYCHSGNPIGQSCGADGTCYLIPLGECSDGFTYTEEGTVLEVLEEYSYCKYVSAIYHYKSMRVCPGDSAEAEIVVEETEEQLCLYPRSYCHELRNFAYCDILP